LACSGEERANSKAGNAVNRGDEAAFPTLASKAVAATARAGDLENALRWLTAPKVTGFTAKVPARPYLAITDEDVEDLSHLWVKDILAERNQPMPDGGGA
jgi:phage gpG-like protein